MTVAEMQFEFEILIQTMWEGFKELERPNTYTVLRFLNLAQNRYIKEKYLSNPDMRANIEFVRKRSDDLRNLIKRYGTTSPVLSHPATGASNRVIITLPSDYLFYIRSDSRVTRTALPVVTQQWTPNRETNYDEIFNIETGIYNTPILPHPIIVFEESDRLVIYYDSYTSITGYEVTYLRKPKTLVIDDAGSDETIECELAYHTHEEVTRMAAEMYTVEYKFRLAQKTDQETNTQ